MSTNTISKENINEALEPIVKHVKNDGGKIEFVEVDNNYTLKLKLSHACAKCDLPKLVFKEGVLRIVQKKIPEIKDVEFKYAK